MRRQSRRFGGFAVPDQAFDPGNRISRIAEARHLHSSISTRSCKVLDIAAVLHAVKAG